jgi:hypothetical protein
LGKEKIVASGTGQRSKGTCRRADRKEGWTEAKKAAFLEVLGATCNIAAGLRAVEMSRPGLERLRARDGSFRAAMTEVRRRAYLDLEFFALEKMMNGTVKTVTKADGAVETVHEYPLTQAMHLLRLHRDVAGGAGMPEAESEEAGEEQKAEVVERLMRKMRALRARMDREEAAALKAKGGEVGADGGAGAGEAGAPAAAAGEAAGGGVPGAGGAAEEGGAG